MKKPFSMLALASLALLLAHPAQAGKLNVGDPAPALKVANWVKGKSFSKFAKGKVYVVEFWATWCGPCKVSIPHLTELAKKYAGKVTFTGVDVWENSGGDKSPFLDKVSKFVDKMGDKMAYNVATDDLDGTVATDWMKAAGQNGIPTAFVIDQNSRVAWIGHPMSDMDSVLEKVIAKKWDFTAYRKQMAEQQAKEEEQAKKMRPLQEAMGKVSALAKEKKFIEAADMVDTVAAKFPDFADRLLATKFQLLVSGDSEKANDVAKQLADKQYKDLPQGLNMLAWAMVDPKGKYTHGDIDLAIDIASRAVEVSKGKDPAIIDTLAAAYAKKGDFDKAIETEQKAIAAIAGSEYPDKDGLKKELNERLAEYHTKKK